jgi:hypothetical protein
MNPVATTAIFRFHSTFVMNFITWNAVVCTYPQMTFDHVGLTNALDRELMPRTKHCMIKYALCGFDSVARVGLEGNAASVVFRMHIVVERFAVLWISTHCNSVLPRALAAKQMS